VKAAAVGPARPTLFGEDMLLAYLDQIGPTRTGQRALIFRLSRLHRSHRREKHALLVTNVLGEAMVQYPGRLFELANGDIVMICKGITHKAIDETTELLRYLFNDDPLAREGTARADFCAAFDLEVSYAQFIAALEEIRESEAKARAERAPPAPVAPPPDTGPLDPARASELIAAMGRIDLSTMGRRQTVWEMVPGKPAQARFDEFFFSIDGLRQAIGENFDLAKDRQLFFYLMRWLDRYMLTTLLRDHRSLQRPLSVNVNLATLLSPEFAAFDRQRPVDWRDRIILEVQLADLWSDLPAFLRSAEALKRRGYQRCLDGVVHQALPLLNLRRLDVDFIKVVWDDALLQLNERTLRELCAAIADCGRGRLILTRCGRREAIKVGQAMGIHLFQGWQVDQANQTLPAPT